MTMDRWITDTATSPRFPYYTRANADEVGPDPFSPLGWSLGWAQGCVLGVADGYVAFGVLEESEFALELPEVFGNWGGYFYNSLSLPRMMGCRMPGATPEAIDQAYFGDHPGVPKYVPHPQDENEAAAEKLGVSMAWVMSTSSYPEQDAAAAMSRQLVAERPALSAISDAALVARGRAMGPLIREVWKPYCVVCLAASLGPGAVQAICAAIGRADDAVKVLAGVGNIESAEASFAMWDLSRMISRSPELMSLFDGPLDRVLPGLEASSSAAANEFKVAWSALLVEFGHRGPNEWDMRSHSWDTKPSLPLSMLERLRFQLDDRSPYQARADAARRRVELVAELQAMVAADPETTGVLAAGLASAGLFFALRERGKSTCIRVIHEGKLAFLELGARMVERGVISDPQQIFMLLEEELDAFLADPMSFASIIADRDASFATLATVEPPYIVGHQDGVPPISEWPSRNAAGAAATVAVGEVLQGAPGAPGVVTGTARIILDPADAPDLQPTDIMVAPTTDPSWVPLFLSVAGIVVNVGAVASHAAIVSREVGVPCAVSVVDATRRIPDGATITVDGSTGAVTIVAL
jgi:pyruvate,water dikinase